VVYGVNIYTYVWDDGPVSPISKQIRRLAVLARCGQDWNHLPLASLQSEWSAWIQAAQSSPDPHKILVRLASFCQQTDRLRHQARRALMYPRLVLVALLGLCIWFALVPGPSFLDSLLAGSGNPSLLAALALMPLALLTCVCFRWLGQAGWQGAWMGSQLASEIEQILWCSSLAHFLELEVDLATALGWVSEPLRQESNRVTARDLVHQVRAGSSLSQALNGAGWDPLLAWAAQAGEEHHSLADALLEASSCLEEALRHRINLQMALLQPLALILVGLLLALTMGLFWTAYGQAALSLTRT